MSNKRNTALETNFSRKRPIGQAVDNSSKRKQSVRSFSYTDSIPESLGQQRHVEESESSRQPRPLVSLRDGLFGNNKETLQKLAKELENTKHDAPPPKYTIDMKTVKDPETQRKYCSIIKTYLREKNYDGIEPASSRTILYAQFQAVFKFLISFILPEFKFKKKFEDDVMELLKLLRCPLSNLITTTTLRSIGTLHTNPLFFTLLYWLTEYCKRLDKVELFNQDQLNKSDTNDLYRDFTMACYGSHLKGNDDFKEETIKLEEKCDIIYNSRQTQIKSIQKEIETMENDITHMDQISARLEASKQKNIELNQDIEKFKDYIEYTKTKESKYDELNKRIKHEVQVLENKLNQVKIETTNIAKKWAERGITVEMVKQTEADLQKSEIELTSITEKLYQVNQDYQTIEKKYNETKEILEERIQEYNSIIGTGKEIIYNKDRITIEDILNVDIEKEILPDLVNKEQVLRSKIDTLVKETLSSRSTLSMINNRIKERKNEIHGLEQVLARQMQSVNEAHKVEQQCQTQFKLEVDTADNQRQKMKMRAHESLNKTKEMTEKMKLQLIDLKHETKKSKDEINMKLISVIEATSKIVNLVKKSDDEEEIQCKKIEQALIDLNLGK